MMATNRRVPADEAPATPPETVEPLAEVPAELVTEVPQTWSVRYSGTAHRRELTEADAVKLGVPSERAEAVAADRGQTIEVHSQDMYDALVGQPDWKAV